MLFGGALAYWLFNTLGSVIRGTGNMALPASVMVGSGLVYLALSPALILGWGPLPRLGIAGAAAASVTSFSLGSLALLGFLLSGRSLVRPTLRGLRLRWALFWEILRVGAPGSLNTILTNLTVVLLTALVGPFGATALAGYGLGARLEYLQIPHRVRPRLGARHHGRHQHGRGPPGPGPARGLDRRGDGGAPSPARSGSSPRCSRTPGSGSSRATRRCWPPARATCASSGPATASSAPASRSTSPRRERAGCCWPLLSGAARLAIAAAGGFIATRWLGAGLPGLFAAMAGALVAMGLINVAAIRLGAWRGVGRRGA